MSDRRNEGKALHTQLAGVLAVAAHEAQGMGRKIGRGLQSVLDAAVEATLPQPQLRPIPVRVQQRRLPRPGDRM